MPPTSIIAADLGDLAQQLTNGNDFLSGGLVLMVLGTGLSLVYRVLPSAWAALLRKLTVSVEVRDQTVFLWLGDWIQTLKYGRDCRRLSVDVEIAPRFANRARTVTHLVFAPGRGTHVFRYAGRWFWLVRAKEETVTEGGPVRREFYLLRALSRKPDILKDILRQAVARAERRRKGKIAIYVWDRHGDWKEIQLQRGRSIDTVVLPEHVKSRIVADLEAFRESRDWYLDLGVPYRRGYLFHGPPGCGKTSFARALASHFEMSMNLVNLSSAGMSDEVLMESLNTARPDSVLLMEDIDAAFTQRERGDGKKADLTFSGLLNAIDGVAAQEGRIVIMTTNHRERLDPALIRPGRVDVQQYFGLATPEQVRELFLRFYPGEEGLAEQAVAVVGSEEMSAAELQGVFLQAREAPELALQALVGMRQGRGRALIGRGRVEVA